MQDQDPNTRGQYPVFRLLSPDAALPPCDERIAELLRVWRAIRPSADLLPGRQHFDPLAVPKLLRWILLVEVARAPLRFRYRLVGSEHVTAMGRNATGEWLDAAHPAFAVSTAYPQYRAAADGQVAYYRGPPTYVMEKDYIEIERLLTPLARDGKNVDMLLTMTVFAGWR